MLIAFRRLGSASQAVARFPPSLMDLTGNCENIVGEGTEAIAGIFMELPPVPGKAGFSR